VVAFFVDDGLVVARCPEWLQSSFTILLNLFKRIGLQTTVLGKIWVPEMEEEFAAQQTGNAAAMESWRIDCKACGISLVAESLLQLIVAN
jgi:hypothetical protein